MSGRKYKHPFLRTVHKIADRKLTAQYGSDRRQFIKHAGIITAGVGLGVSFLSSCADDKKKSKPKIAIIGAGLAGLCAARAFDLADIAYDFFEASGRAGGRVHSVSNLVADKNIVETGGEFIDSDHEEILNLIDSFKLELTDLKMDELQEVTYYFEGKRYAALDLDLAMERILPEMYPDFALLPEYIEPGNMAQWMFFDKLSLGEYLDQVKLPNWLRQLFVSAYETEFGMNVYKQSSLNFFTLFEPVSETFAAFGDKDLRFKIKGGNELLIKKLVGELKQKIQFNAVLTGISEESGLYHLTFQKDKEQFKQTYEYCLMAIPFSVLRKIELNVNLPELKRKAIFELGYGKNSKAFLGFNAAVWRNTMDSGDVYSDLQLKRGWESSRMQDATQKTFVVVNTATKEEETENTTALKDELIAKMDAIFPGSAIAFNDRFEKVDWYKNPWSLGSTSVYTQGQWSLFYGSEFEPVGNLHFAGEHTSRVYQGTMNGAVESGQHAASDIIEKLKKVG
jgi:monoamine oxidase